MIECTDLSLEEARSLPALPSHYSTRDVYRLTRAAQGGALTWHLDTERLSDPYQKTYDDGVLDNWLETYEEAGNLASLRFVAAHSDSNYAGLLTWQPVRWNNTAWLIDIRVRDEFRRQGVGSTLLRRLQMSGRRSRLRGISVETQINNYPAIQFYIRHGFSIAGFQDHLYSNEDVETQDIALFLFWRADQS